MVLNTGPKTNMEVFRDYFNNNTSLDYDECEPIFWISMPMNFKIV